jgi:predicted metal-dependent hydrolase
VTVKQALFDYQLRVSPRARNVYLRVTPERGLEVVVPRGFNPILISTMLEEKERWIRRALARAEAQRRLEAPCRPWALPPEIRLPGIDRIWTVIGEPSSRRVSVIESGKDRLTVHGRIDDEAECRAALRRWLVVQAQHHLVPWLDELSGTLGLSYRRVSFRFQRTRWGSCSRHRSINLNVKLLFLPAAVARYVLVHELCHLREMNHSRRFWALVAQHDPEARRHDRALRDGWQCVPGWAEPLRFAK